MRLEHTLSQQLLKRGAVQVMVVGAGGTGSAVLMGLHRPSMNKRVAMMRPAVSDKLTCRHNKGRCTIMQQPLLQTKPMAYWLGKPFSGTTCCRFCTPCRISEALAGRVEYVPVGV